MAWVDRPACWAATGLAWEKMPEKLAQALSEASAAALRAKRLQRSARDEAVVELNMGRFGFCVGDRGGGLAGSLDALGVVKNAAQKALECFKLCATKALKMGVLYVAQDARDIACSGLASRGEFEVDDAAVLFGAHPLAQAFGLHAVEQAGGRAVVDLAGAGEFGHCRGLLGVELEERNPLRIGELGVGEFPVNGLGHVIEDAAHQVPHAGLRLVVVGAVKRSRWFGHGANINCLSKYCQG